MSDSMLDHIRSFGYSFNPEFDGEIHRFSMDGRKDKSGWYIGQIFKVGGKEVKYLNYGDWAKNESLEFCSRKRFSKEDRAIFEKLQCDLDKKISAAREKAFLESVETWKKDLERGTDATKENPYLSKKGVIPVPLLKDVHGTLLVPIFSDFKLTLCGLQTIFSDSKKLFERGSRTGGAFFPIEGKTEMVFICEGVATGISIHMATGMTVICALNAGNLYSITEKCISHFKDSEIVICCDNDMYTIIGGEQKNVGIEAGKKCVVSFNVKLKFPVFKNLDSKPNDFNDLHILEGLTEVKKQIMSDLKFYPTKDDGFYFKIEVDGKSGFYATYEPDYVGISEYLTDTYKLSFGPGFQYKYENGFYSSFDDTWLEKTVLDLVVKRKTTEKPDPNEIKKFCEFVRMNNLKDDSKFKSSIGMINLENGILDSRYRKVIPHSPDYMLKYKLNFSYDPKARCVEFEKFLLDVFNNDPVLPCNIFEIIGYTLLGGKPFLEKSFLLYGTTEGSNGKSVFLDILEAVIGEANISRVGMGSLSNEYRRIALDGKIANIVNETPSNKQLDSEYFNAIVTGNAIEGRDLFKSVRFFKPTVRMFFSCNLTPSFSSIGGSLRRIHPIPFQKIYDGENKDVRKAEKIIQTECPGILARSVEALEDLLGRGYLVESENTREAILSIKKDTDRVFDFMENNYMIEKSGSSSEIVIREMYFEFKNFCIKYRGAENFSMGLNTFSKRVCDYLRARSGSSSSVYKTARGYATRIIRPNNQH